MIKKIMQKTQDLSLRYKLFISYLALVTLPFCLFMVINIYFTTRDREQETLYSLQQVLNQTKSFLEFKTVSVKSTLNFLALNDTVQELVTKDADIYRRNLGFWVDDNMQFTRVTFNSTYNAPDISGVHLYMKSGLAEITETDEYILLSHVDTEDWYQKVVESNNNVEWFPGSEFGIKGKEEYVSAVRKIPSDQSISGFVGIIRIDMPMSAIKTTLEKSLFTKNTSAFLINSSKEIICSIGNRSLAGNPKFINAIINLADYTESNTWKKKKFGKDTFLMASQNIQDTDWKLILAIPYRDILESSMRTRREMLLILLCVAPLTLPLALITSDSITKRIRKLITYMKKAEKGDFHTDILPAGKDEIGQLTHSFNHMLIKISQLIDERFRMGREMKNLELKALQAQINPHFLYNTLDLINWMSIKYKAPEIGSLVRTLSDFYKFSLRKGEDIVSIGDELKHVQAYVFIQNIRFSNNIHLEIKVPEELYEYRILKIVLQPLVENAILHGIQEKDLESGTIEIGGSRENNDILLYVKDDGVGIAEDQLPDVLTGSVAEDHHGYGVKNIHERLQLNYGKEYGLRYESKKGAGTTVYIRIPATR